MFVTCAAIANEGHVKKRHFQENVQLPNSHFRFVLVTLVDVTARKIIKAFSVTDTNVCLFEQVMWSKVKQV